MPVNKLNNTFDSHMCSWACESVMRAHYNDIDYNCQIKKCSQYQQTFLTSRQLFFKYISL